MTALADYYNTQRQTVLEMRQSNKLGADMARRFHQTGAVEILAKLRSVLEGIEKILSEDCSCEPEFEGQMHDWEILHHEAMGTIGAMMDSECEASRQ
jgi:hypothetical protein